MVESGAAEGSGGDPQERAGRDATAAGLAAVVLWCLTGPLIAAGTRELAVWPFLAISSAIGALTGAIVHLARGRPLAEIVALPGRVLLAGFFGVAVYTILLTLAVGLADERDLGQVVLVNYLWPIWIVVLGVPLTGRGTRGWLTLAAAALGLGGVLVSRGVELLARPAGSLVPHALALAGSILWAAYSVLLRRWRVPVERCGSTLQFALCALIAAILAVATGENDLVREATPRGWLLALGNGLGPIGLGYYLWEIGAKRGATHLIAVAAYFIPVASAALVALLFREAAHPGLVPGTLMIAVGAALAGRAGGARRARERASGGVSAAGERPAAPRQRRP